jgi:hypothetical protein
MADPSSLTRLETAHIWTELVSKLLGAIAIVVAAWWTYTNFTVERTHDPTMEVTVSPTVGPLPDGKTLLNVDVLLRNVGKVAIMPRFAHDPTARDSGLEISIVEIAPFDRTAPTAAPPAGQPDPTVPWFDWSEGDGNPRPIVHKRNLLASNEDFRAGRYQLNPGVKYREPFACIVEANKLYAIRARFWTDEGSVADLVYVDTFLEAKGGSR